MSGNAVLTATPNAPRLEDNWRFAEFIACSISDPEVGALYRRDPAAALAAFGLTLPEGGARPRIPSAGVVIEGLEEYSSLAYTACKTSRHEA